MNAVLLGAALAILLGILLILIRAFLGPTVYDRILAVNAMGTKTVIFLGILGFISRRPDWLDIAIAYAMINFVSTIAILKLAEFKRLG